MTQDRSMMRTAMTMVCAIVFSAACISVAVAPARAADTAVVAAAAVQGHAASR